MVAWIFIAPTIVLLLAINIFPLIWAIQLSFTNYRANRPNEPIKNIGLSNYSRILTDTDTWIAMQATAHFVFWTIILQTLIGFTLAYLIDRLDQDQIAGGADAEADLAGRLQIAAGRTRGRRRDQQGRAIPKK